MVAFTKTPHYIWNFEFMKYDLVLGFIKLEDPYQRRRKDGNEDVRVSHGVEQGHQGHATVRQSREWLWVKKKFVFGQGGDEKT